MRPASPYRRHSAIALVFAAWCAAYGLPAELVRDLTVQTVGYSQLGPARPGKQAKVLLDRLSTRVRRSEQVRVAFFQAFLAPAATAIPVANFAALPGAPAPARTPGVNSPAQFQRPPPPSFSA